MEAVVSDLLILGFFSFRNLFSLSRRINWILKLNFSSYYSIWCCKNKFYYPCLLWHQWSSSTCTNSLEYPIHGTENWHTLFGKNILVKHSVKWMGLSSRFVLMPLTFKPKSSQDFKFESFIVMWLSIPRIWD